MIPEKETKLKVVKVIEKIDAGILFWREQSTKVPMNDPSIPMSLWGKEKFAYSTKIGKVLVVITTETQKPIAVQIAYIDTGSGFEAMFPHDDVKINNLIDSIKLRLDEQPHVVLELLEKELECLAKN